MSCLLCALLHSTASLLLLPITHRRPYLLAYLVVSSLLCIPRQAQTNTKTNILYSYYEGRLPNLSSLSSIPNTATKDCRSQPAFPPTRLLPDAVIVSAHAPSLQSHRATTPILLFNQSISFNSTIPSGLHLTRRCIQTRYCNLIPNLYSAALRTSI